AGSLAHAAKLRFTHAEIIIPFAERLGIPRASKSVPSADAFTYFNNPWRGAQIAPLAANIQGDLYSNGATLLVKINYNEEETDFPPACESARYVGDGGRSRPFASVKTHYYEYLGIKSCYGY